MTKRPDVVIPPSLPPQVRQVITAIYQRLRQLETDLATKADAAATRTASSVTTIVGNGGGTAPSTGTSPLPVTTLTANGSAPVPGVYLIDASGGPIDVLLPTVVGKGGRFWYLIRVDETANRVLIITDGAETINGEPDAEMLAQDSLTLTGGGTAWRVV